MSRSRPILILTSCTALKAPASLERQVRAERLYAGQQHVRLMRGVQAYRVAGQPAGPVRLRIVSAGSGLLSASTKLGAYEATFQGLPRREIRKRAARLGLPEQVRALLRKDWAMIMILLGDDYLTAIDLDIDTEIGGPAVAFSGARVATRLPVLDELSTVAIGTAEAKRLSCGLVSLKGEIGGRTLAALANQPAQLEALSQRGFPWLDWLDALPATGCHDRVQLARLPVLRTVQRHRATSGPPASMLIQP